MNEKHFRKFKKFVNCSFNDNFTEVLSFVKLYFHTEFGIQLSF